MTERQLKPRQVSRLERFTTNLANADVAQKAIDSGQELHAIQTREDGKQVSLYPINQRFVDGMRKVGHSLYESLKDDPDTKEVADEVLRVRREIRQGAAAAEKEKIRRMWDEG